MSSLPVDLLVVEHWLIERIIVLAKKEIERVTKTLNVNPNFIIVTIDFLRSYADKCHHGKEEGILFKGLSKKQLSDVDDRIMRELELEHTYARRTVNNLESLKDSYVAGNLEASKEILQLMTQLVEFYPIHIKKEDEQFFYPSMKYFNAQEQTAMINEFEEFDRNFIHKKYQQIVSALETVPQNGKNSKATG